VVLLQRPQGAQPFAQGTAHAQQPQRIPAGMAGNRELVEISKQVVLQIRVRHLARAVSSTLGKAPVPWPAAGANHQKRW